MLAWLIGIILLRNPSFIGSILAHKEREEKERTKGEIEQVQAK